MTYQSDVINNPNYKAIFGHGFVGLVDSMGSDETICRAARVSYGKGTKTTSDDRNLLRYLVRNRHSSPTEMGQLVFHLKMPIFVMRQHIRHRTASTSEMSARYSELSNEFYVPEDSMIQGQNETNKQGRSGIPISCSRARIVRDSIWKSHADAYATYEKMLKVNVARETARGVLPVNVYTECYWRIDMNNFGKYLKLRLDSHAQYEIRVMARRMESLAMTKFPVLMEAYRDFLFEAQTFSRMEMTELRRLVAGSLANWEPDVLLDMGKREINEFRERLERRTYES